MKQPHIWLIGCKGMLGTEIARQLTEKQYPWTGTDREVDITDPAALAAFAAQYSGSAEPIGWIINCSAYTAVDKAEDEPELAAKLNRDGAANIAATAKNIGAKMIHISTDYVFDGTATEPYTEDCAKCPASVYGATKAAGEDAVSAILPEDSYILRTAWLYGYDGKNFVYTMVRAMNEYDSRIVVDDQRGTPTFAGDLANAVLTLIGRETAGQHIAPGVYHCTDLGNISWYDFACEIYRIGRQHNLITSECAISPCKSGSFPAKAKRPAYSVLSKDKLQSALGIRLPQWQDSLAHFMTSPLFAVPDSNTAAAPHTLNKDKDNTL